MSAIGIRIEQAELRAGDRIAFELPVEYEEQDVTSLQMEREPVEVVPVGQLAGALTTFTKEQIKKNTKVYKVRSQTRDTEREASS